MSQSSIPAPPPLRMVWNQRREGWGNVSAISPNLLGVHDEETDLLHRVPVLNGVAGPCLCGAKDCWAVEVAQHYADRFLAPRPAKIGISLLAVAEGLLREGDEGAAARVGLIAIGRINKASFEFPWVASPPLLARAEAFARSLCAGGGCRG